MSSYASQSSQSTWSAWSEYEWNKAGYWTSYRMDQYGNIEDRYEYQNSDPAPQEAIPRTTDAQSNQSVFGSDSRRGSGGSTYSNQYLPDTGTGSTIGAITSYSAGQASFPSSSAAYGSSGSYSQSPVSYAVAKAGYEGVEKVTEGLRNLDVGQIAPGYGKQSQCTSKPDTDQQLQNPIDQKHIRREPCSASTEKLDDRYREITDPKESRSFWKVGRVFMVLWMEPAGAQIDDNGGTRNGSHISTAWLEEKVLSEIRRFVIVRDGYGSCICLAIHTYSGRATLKPSLPDPWNHSIIYTSKKVPKPHSENRNGDTMIEELTLDPIKVHGDHNKREGTLDPKSRIHFTKTYTVEKDVRVLNIGMVDEKSMPALLTYSPLKPEANPYKAPSKRRPASSSKLEKHDKPDKPGNAFGSAYASGSGSGSKHRY